MPPAWKQFAQDYAFLFGGAAGACLTFIFLGLKQFFGRPRLRLDFNKDDEAYLSESTHLEGENPEVMVTRKYLRVSVKATGILRSRIGGSSGARNCRIYVTSIQPIQNGKPQHDHIYDARPTSWPPNKDFVPRDIPKGIIMFANVVTMRKGRGHWHFQIPDTYGLSDDLLNHQGLMRIGVTATADNAKPSTIYVRAAIKADRSGFEVHKERRFRFFG